MRKVNQILMATVAILLTLVLISTSVVSSVFARFTITKSAETTVELQKFGVKVTLSNDSRLDAFKQTDLEVKKGDSGSVTFSGLTMKPGDEYPKALVVKFEGKPTVPVKVTVKFHFEYLLGNFKVPKGVAGVTADGGKNMMPIGLRFGASNNAVEVIKNDYAGTSIPYRTMTADNTEDSIVNHIQKNIVLSEYYFKTDVSTDTYICNIYEAGDDILFYTKGTNSKAINELEFGFDWPFEYVDTDGDYDYDIAGTWLAKNRWDPNQYPISFTYTVTIEQN